MKEWIQLLAAVSPLFAAGITLYVNFKLNQVKAIATETNMLVNGVHQRLIDRNVQLEETIKDSDKEIPPTTRDTGLRP